MRGKIGLYIQCPFCKTKFEISADQLRASSGGMVRCIPRGHIFFAYTRIIERDEGTQKHTDDTKSEKRTCIKEPLPRNMPTIFISYSHDNKKHNAWVLKLAMVLKKRGMAVRLDQLDLSYGDNLFNYMQNSAKQSDRVIVVCSDNYIRKINQGSGGAAFEAMILTDVIIRDINTTKIIPLIRNHSDPITLPSFLTGRYYVDFRNDIDFPNNLESLIRCINQLPFSEMPDSGLIRPTHSDPN